MRNLGSSRRCFSPVASLKGGLLSLAVCGPVERSRLPSSPDLSGRIEAPVSGAIGEWPSGASIRLRWRGATRQPAALSPLFLFLFPFFIPPGLMVPPQMVPILEEIISLENGIP